MLRKLALKKLKPSDLSFFQSYLRKNPRAKQKGFNLDKKILEETFYPSLSEVVDDRPGKRALVSLEIFGPGLVEPHNLARKILKQEKNWRLNGEAIHDPDESPNRYDALRPDDYAIMEFGGTGAPDSVKVVLVAASHPDDATTHVAIRQLHPVLSMVSLSELDVERVIDAGKPPLSHPIRDWLDKELLEDAARGGATSLEILSSRRLGRGMTLTELQSAKQSAERVGLWGEGLLNHFFSESPPANTARHVWAAQANAVSLYDFTLELNDGTIRHIDAKSTSGNFENPIHLSLGELLHAATSGVAYDLYRLYVVTETTGTMRIARDIGPKLSETLTKLAELPSGVKVDSLSFTPSFFVFDDERTQIEIKDEGT